MTEDLESLLAKPQQIVEAGKEVITNLAQELTADNIVWTAMKSVDTAKSLLPDVSIADALSLSKQAATAAKNLDPSLFKSMLLKQDELGPALRLMKDLLHKGTGESGDRDVTPAVVPSDEAATNPGSKGEHKHVEGAKHPLEPEDQPKDEPKEQEKPEAEDPKEQPKPAEQPEGQPKPVEEQPKEQEKPKEQPKDQPKAVEEQPKDQSKEVEEQKAQQKPEEPKGEVIKDKDGRPVRDKREDGDYVMRDGKWIKDEKLHPLNEMYNPKIPFEDADGNRNAMGEKLHQRAEALLKEAANQKGEISFPAHGRMLKQIADMQDLTEAEKLYVYERVLAGEAEGRDPNSKPTAGALRPEGEGRYRLINEGNKTPLSGKGDFVRHVAISPTNDGYHGSLVYGGGSLSEKALRGFMPGEAGIASHELEKAIGKTLWPFGGFGFKPTMVQHIDFGDAAQSKAQIDSIRGFQERGFAGYADQWNEGFVKTDSAPEKSFTDKVQEKVQGAVEDVQKKGQELKEDAQRKIGEAQEKLEEVQHTAEEMKKNLEQEAQKKLEEAQRIAEETKRTLEQEAQKKLEEAQRKAEEMKRAVEQEAQRQLEEAQRKAEEAKRMYEEAQRRIEEEAQRRIEQGKDVGRTVGGWVKSVFD